MRHFDPALLQTLVAFDETGTLARTAEVVGRTPSAVTAQMQRLEASAGIALLKTAGRRRVLTDAGERLVAHARRILTAEREAWLDLSGAEADGQVGIGLTQDFTGDALPSILNEFARAHPRVRFDLRIGRSVELIEALEAARIDVLVAMRHTVEPDEVALIREPMVWLAAKGGLVEQAGDALPLALLDPPCGFRTAALNALEGQSRPYRVAATSASLAGLSAAVRAGIAVTVRTRRWTSATMAANPKSLDLPKLPDAEFSIRVRGGANDSAKRLGDVLADRLRFRA